MASDQNSQFIKEKLILIQEVAAKIDQIEFRHISLQMPLLVYFTSNAINRRNFGQ